MVLKWNGDIKRNRMAAITLHKVGMMRIIIFTLDISQMFVYRSIDTYNETSSVTEKIRPSTIIRKR